MKLKTALAVVGCFGFGICSYAPAQLSSSTTSPFKNTRQAIHAQSVPNPIPASRRIDWSRTGVPGGIPSRTVIGATVDPLIYGNGTTDATQAIQTAINNCPENQVVLVYLPAGIYLVRAGLGSTTKNNITIRGDGPDKTIIKAGLATFSQGVFSFGEAVWASANYPANLVLNISLGFTKGSTAIAIDSASNITNSGLAIGDLLQISELNDPSFVNSVGSSGSFGGFTDRDHIGQRNLQQIVRVTAVSGNTVSFYPALYWTYSANLSPQAAAIPGTIHAIGLVLGVVMTSQPKYFEALSEPQSCLPIGEGRYSLAVLEYEIKGWVADRVPHPLIESSLARYHVFASGLKTKLRFGIKVPFGVLC